jgi:hypothetical protein
MKSKIAITLLTFAMFSGAPTSSLSAGDDFNAVVKTIEQFYQVKHQSIPFLARAGMKVARTAARIKGGEARRLADAGSVRVAVFEDQDFNSRGQIASFKASMLSTLNNRWSPLVQTMAPREEAQTYIFVREAGEKFHVIVVTIERRDATVVQATVAPNIIGMLLRDPNEMGKALTEDATINDN